jgi:hypothetical protein
MPLRRRGLFAIAVAAVALILVAATCRKAEPASAAPAADPTPAATSAPAPAAPADPSSASGSELPGFDLSTLPEAARAEVQKVVNDEFCYCGCPHTIAGCLKEHPACEHAKRETQIAAWLAEGGEHSFEIIADLGKYFRSFKEPRKTIDLTNAACKGPADAAVTVVEFADFQCPACGAAHPMLERFFAKSDGRIRFCFKNYPLPAHPDALWAAEAGEYAREHGKFWEMHDLMFTNQEALRLLNLRDYAKKVGLDPDDLDRAVTADKYLPRIDASKDEGRKLGVESTPSLFVNGRPLSLPVSVGILLRAVEDEREWREKGGWHAD